MSHPRQVTIVPPAELTGLRRTPVKDHAAGLPAVTIALKHIAEEAGLWRGLKALSKLNQRHGIDCPGCAWPEPDHRSAIAEYCENGAKAIAEEATTEKCDIEFFSKFSVEEMSTWSDFKIGKSGRVVHPMYLPKGKSHYEPVSWERAYAILCEELNACAHPDEAVFYTSGRTSNEAAYLYQLFIRQFGTNNLPDCSNMCHESSGVALNETIGIGKGTVTLNDLHEAELIIVMGQNPGTNHPRMLSALTQCKKNGGTIIHVNPLPEAGTSKFINPQSPVEVLLGGTKLADQFLQIRIGGDLAFLKLVNHYLLKKEEQAPGCVVDSTFVESKTTGFTDWKEETLSFDKEQALKDCGLAWAQIEEVGETIANKKKMITCWAMGITQQKHGVNTIREIVNLHLIRGAVGKPGAGLCPVRGHSNVQGDRTMGIYEKPRPEFLDALDRQYDMKSPRSYGFDTVEAIEAMHHGKVKVFMAMGGNFISATPDSEFTGKAMQRCSLTVHVSTKLNRAHLVTGEHALLLPCLGRTEKDLQTTGEQFVTVENSMGVVSLSKGILDPASHQLRSEPAIVAELAHCLLGSSLRLPWLNWRDNYDLIRNEIEAVIPGFAQYNEKVRGKDGFYLPNGPREQRFTTSIGKALFTANALPNVAIPDGHFVMMTIRSHDQYNTTIYGLNDRYRGIANERRIVLAHPEDLKNNTIEDGELIDLVSVHNGEERRAERFHAIAFDIAKGCIATYFPETNCLVPLSSVADKSNTPVSKFVVVRMKKRV